MQASADRRIVRWDFIGCCVAGKARDHYISIIKLTSLTCSYKEKRYDWALACQILDVLLYIHENFNTMYLYTTCIASQTRRAVRTQSPGSVIEAP